MKKIILICLILLFSNVFAGAIYSTNVAVEHFISINEDADGGTTFDLCSGNENCTPLAGGETFSRIEIKRLILDLKKTRNFLIAADVGVSIAVAALGAYAGFKWGKSLEIRKMPFI